MQKAVKALKARRKGFTVIEIMAVIAVIAILLLTATNYYQDYTDDARLAAVKQNIGIINEAISRYFKDHMEYPKTFKDLVDKNYIAPPSVQALKEALARLNMNIMALYCQKNPLCDGSNGSISTPEWGSWDTVLNPPGEHFSRIRLEGATQAK